ncbi:mannose-6-phosphate isomerase, class I [Flavitalea sp. BT771]|uniref:mannose-6-phosphate isomerase, class I n=1 Tax=Flavitalea sp. BT771 TaxID=3063329 RepID=UPI0026E2644B|nr:mannose-6-phosphate isomerase, class I [Flavitalea sp. BT771]MDO6431005.1 mannose-6-phosphate isomerase, class I [Flavitalea sp. BT771]MDV6219912.1 mannose-6-phosphate isomerase, class I [Flavitalea sp. BT771]
MQQGKNVFKLKGKIQQYAWGGQTYLSKLLSVANPENKPFAEYWLGAHDNAPAELEGAEPAKLNEYVRLQPETSLGAAVAQRFGRLPYLLKILDVKDMLSIQVHPTKKNAELEFAMENEKGIALGAPHRNYKDDNHKPELMLALSDFWLLHGFKPEEELMHTLSTVPELRFLLPVFSMGGYKELYKEVMEMPQQEVNALLKPLLDRIIPLYQQKLLRKQDEDFWAARAALTYNEGDKIDRGIFSVYFFNLVNVHPGEAVFQDAGLPHAYLEGQNVEIMANSDNVLRGGLTPKHVDVPELLKHVRFEATHPHIIRENNTPGHIVIYKTPAPDFELSKINLQAGEIVTIQSHSVEIFLVLEGKVQVEDSNGFDRKAGDAFIAFDKAKISLRADQDTLLYRASVPKA